ncbi:hypothetical protein [Cryobacterium sp. Hh38]|uniref:hypothetical protein n=1 Tax=Cryobacterium sp. Hh38 TaxID=1259156 RepID=UPI0015808EC2|nr:hypothetical protein [Cryobacterium sp. Hh38]
MTINSDDLAHFGGYLDDNFRGLQQTFVLDDPAMAAPLRNAVHAAFRTDTRRAPLLEDISSWLEAQV